MATQTHTTEIAHTLGRTEAMARLKAYMGWARGYSDLKGSWEGNTFTFAVSMQGASFSGTIQVEENCLKLQNEVPLLAPRFATWLPGLVRTALLPRGPNFGAVVEASAGSTAKTDSAPTVLFLHIPKAGGTSLSTYITNQCSAGEYRDGGGLLNAGIVSLQYGFFKDPELHVPAHIRPMLRRPEVRAVVGHFTFGIHEHLARPWTYITVLRDPVDRIVSMYYFLELQNRMSLEEFAAAPPFREIDNDQTRRIAGVDPELGTLTRATLETAKENLRRHFSVMGTIERSEETLVLLNRRLGWTKDVPLTARNVTRERKSVTSLPPSTVEAIRSWNELDVELYRFVSEWMDQAIAEEGTGFQDELARRRALGLSGNG